MLNCRHSQTKETVHGNQCCQSDEKEGKEGNFKALCISISISIRKLHKTILFEGEFLNLINILDPATAKSISVRSL